MSVQHQGKDRPFEWAYAAMVAKAIVHHLEPFCQKVRIAGSIRRRKPRVKDIEIVALPKYRSTREDLFGQSESVESMLPLGIDSYNRCEEGGMVLRMNPDTGKPMGDGPKMKLLRDKATGIPIDLFIVEDPHQWGYIFCLRTGPAEWNKRVIEDAKRREGVTFHKGRVLDRNMEAIPVPTERAYFEAVGMEYVPPQERTLS